MKTTTRKRLRIGLMAAALIVLWGVNAKNPNGKITTMVGENLLDQNFSFGMPEGVYSHDIALELSTNIPISGWEIYYTTDGSRPTRESDLYTQPLLYPIGEHLQLIQINAVVYLDGEEVGGPYSGTFLLTQKPEMLEDVYIFSITSDYDGLFGEEKGILYPAYSFVTTDSDEEYNKVHAQNFAQRGADWVRDAHVTILDEEAKIVIDQDCGLSVSGQHGSLMHYPFSLQLKADESYQKGKNVFAYDFFAERSISEDGMNYYDSITLKNSGNDYTWGAMKENTSGTMLKNTIGSRMAKELGLLSSGQRIAVVFLNGEFYNVAYLNASLNEKAIAVQTGLNDDYVITKKSREKQCLTDAALKKLYHSFPDMEDSNIFERRQEFERKVDVENLFRYYAFELITGNTDWPTNNYAMWRYIGNERKDNPYSDGRYRYWVFDMDCMYGTQEWMTDPWDAIFGETNTDNCLLPILMQIDDYRIQFVNTVLDELNSEAFDEEHLMELVDEESERLSPWFAGVYGAEAEADRRANVELLKEKMLARRGQVMGYLKKYFHADSPYTLCVEPCKGLGTVKLGSMELPGEIFSGTYDTEYPVTLRYEDSAIDTIDYWIVNGEKIEAEELTIQEGMIQDGSVTVEPVVKRQRRAGLLD